MYILRPFSQLSGIVNLSTVAHDRGSRVFGNTSIPSQSPSGYFQLNQYNKKPIRFSTTVVYTYKQCSPPMKLAKLVLLSNHCHTFEKDETMFIDYLGLVALLSFFNIFSTAFS